MKCKSLTKIVITIISVVTVLTACYIMANGLGLIDSLDFGAGAYYYADIPGFEKYVNGDSFTAAFPMWFYILLFLIWGGIMYRLWSFLEKKL